MITIGIDPDSKAHGVAVYENGKLNFLFTATLLELQGFIEHTYSDCSQITVNIEDVNAVSASFNARDKKSNINVKLKMAQHIGQCKQAQIELERLFDYMGIRVKHHKISKQWKKNKTVFEKATGWKGRSNEDTRSAAYFGYLGLR